MPRSRNIKYALFDNDKLAELGFAERYLFIGLWTIADFNGCFEYRPARLHKQLLGYDHDVDIEQLMNNLSQAGFIRLYSVQNKNYAQVVNFKKHQNPHRNEIGAGSLIPEPDEVVANDNYPKVVANDNQNEVVENINDPEQVVDSKGDIQESGQIACRTDKIGTRTAKIGSAPADSLFLIPDTCTPIPDKNKRSKTGANSCALMFDPFWEIWPKKVGKAKALKVWKSKKLDKHSEAIMEALPNHIEAWSDIDRKYIPYPEKWLSGEHWNDELSVDFTNLTNNESEGAI